MESVGKASGNAGEGRSSRAVRRTASATVALVSVSETRPSANGRRSTGVVAYSVIAAVCIVPRLAVLIHGGESIKDLPEQSVDIARNFVDSGTFGQIPGIPTAYTQPIYAFFLIPLIWAFGYSWLALGLAQIAVATAVAILVYEIGRHVTTRRGALIAALIATLQPYLIWHDVHLNREILDQLLGAAMVLVALRAFERRSLGMAAVLGGIAGVAILSNARLVLLPLVLAAYLLLGRVRAAAAVAVVVVAALVVTPWVVRNRVHVGCVVLTTYGKALWKANNANTYSTLANGGWIDDVPELPGVPPTPIMAGAIWRANHEVVRVDECAQNSFYQHQVWTFVKKHPGEKVKLAGQATMLLWQPTVHRDVGRPSPEGGVDWARRVAEPAYVIPLYLLAIAGLFVVGRSFRILALMFVGYETFTAWVFAGTTRYRVAWDFLLAVLAAVAIEAFLRRWARRRNRPSSAAAASSASTKSQDTL
jgi:hypothetical protein